MRRPDADRNGDASDPRPVPVSRRSRRQLAALAVAMVFPALLTWLYFVRLATAPTGVQQAVYAVGKTVQFAFPALFVWVVLRERERFLPRGRGGVVEGVLSGLAVLVAIFALYRFLEIVDAELLSTLSPRIAAKVAGLGIETPTHYLALGAFYALLHSFLEEYYWRWFVFDGLRRLTSVRSAIALSGIAFAAHHLLLMGFYTGWNSPFAYLFTAAVAGGGAYWAWLYQRRRTLLAPWVSHLFVDAAIFLVGYDLVGPL